MGIFCSPKTELSSNQMAMKQAELKEFLDAKAELYNRPDFIESDPIQIPHRFTTKEYFEISCFLAATIAWGNRKMIINSANKTINALGNNPYDFVMSATDEQINRI